MKTFKTSEVYAILEADETGLIPTEVSSVVVTYYEGGSTIFYNAGKKTEEINTRAPTTLEGIEKIISLLQSSQITSR